MAEKRIGIIMHGVTGRMGATQHLARSIMAIRRQGGIALSDGTRLVPEPILVGRNAAKLAALGRAHGLRHWTTDLDRALSDSDAPIFFDAATTGLRAGLLAKAIGAGKHVYCEKPVAASLDEALAVYRRAEAAGVKHGVVQDKLWLPGIRKLKRLIESGFFGRLLSVRGEFGYWVFDGERQPAQRPSWNYQKARGGGIILDMLAHWRYLLDDLFGAVQAVSCLGAVHVPARWDEDGRRYDADAEDAAYATFRLAGGVIAHFNSTWTVRVRRDDLLTLQADGTEGSAVAGLRRCWTQSRDETPAAVWAPDAAPAIDYFDRWREVPDEPDHDNAFKAQWELFLRHVAEDAPFPWNLREGAKGVQLAELARQSWAEGRWIEVPELAA